MVYYYTAVGSKLGHLTLRGCYDHHSRSTLFRFSLARVSNADPVDQPAGSSDDGLPLDRRRAARVLRVCSPLCARAHLPLEPTDRRRVSLFVRSLLSDVQYADVDDGWNFHHTSQRFYRNALQLLQDAVAEWVRASSSSALTPLSFAVNLGDLIDGKNRMVGTSQMALDRAKAAWVPFQESVGPVHHLVGNHELYNLTPEELRKQLLWWRAAPNAAAGSPASYYDFVSSKAPRFRFVVLNCYGVSSLGRAKDDPVAVEAYKTLRAMNPNANLNSPEGLAGNDARFVEYNGGVDRDQVTWLKGVLKDAQRANEHVVVFTHIPLHPQSTYPSSLLWNYQELLDVIYDAKCVRVVFSGHSHDDGYVVENGVHFVVCDAILECAPNTNAHAIVHVHEDKLVMQGFGKISTRELLFPAAALS